MSNFETAFSNLMQVEGGKTKDTGGYTNYGITLSSLLETRDRDFDIDHDGDLDKDDLWSMDIVHARLYVYRYWWTRYRLNEIKDTSVASKCLDVLYNMGRPRGTRVVQASCNKLLFKKKIDVDGLLGGETLKAVNSLPPLSLLKCIREKQASWYRYLAETNPGKYQKYLKGWLRRAAL